MMRKWHRVGICLLAVLGMGVAASVRADVPAPSYALRVYQTAKGTVKMTCGKTTKTANSGKTLSASIAPGKTVKLAATAPSGYVFTGWDSSIGLGRKWRQTSISFAMPSDEETPLWAMYVKKAQDYIGLFLNGYSANRTWCMEDVSDEYEIFVESGSYASLSASGVPAGMKVVADSDDDCCWYLRVVDESKIKRGTTSTITFTAKNRAGKTQTRKLKVIMPNKTTAEDMGLLDGLDSSDGEGSGYSYTAGLKVSGDSLDLEVAGGWKLSVSGLPTGLTWNASSMTISGVPSKAGTYVATFKVTRGKTSYASTALFTVTALPTGVAGTYTGFTRAHDDELDTESTYEDEYFVFGTASRKVKVSVSSGGAITATVGSYSLKGSGLSVYDGKYSGQARYSKKVGKTTYDYILNFTIDPTADSLTDQLTGGFYISFCTGNACIAGWTNADCVVRARRAPTGDAASAVSQMAALGTTRFAVDKESSREYVLGCEACVYCPSGKCSFPVTAKVAANGTVTIAGKIAGKKVSGTAQIEITKPTDDWAEYIGYARFILKPDSKTSMFIELKYEITQDYGAYQPNGWAKIK